MQNEVARGSAVALFPTETNAEPLADIHGTGQPIHRSGRRMPRVSKVWTAERPAAAMASLVRALRAWLLATGKRAIAPSRPTLVTRMENMTSKIVTPRRRGSEVRGRRSEVGAV